MVGFVLAGLTACSLFRKVETNKKSIVILYENDVHCAIDGYTKLAGLRDAINKADTAWTAVVSCGDFLQGGTPGAISKGRYIVDIMRSVGYDAITLGNHEFDYGTPHMMKLLPQIGTDVVCANFFEVGQLKPYYKPYVIKQYGRKRVAFVGACTTETMRSEAYSFYDDEGRLLYDLKPEEMVKLVQKAVDNARKDGADYVVVLSHLGEEAAEDAISSHDLVSSTRGIDVVLDGHSHSVIEHDNVNALDGKTITVTETGTGFANVGKLVIAADGRISTTLVPAGDISFESAAVTAAVAHVKSEMEKVVSQQLCQSDFPLDINDSEGVRQSRRSEVNLGDLVTDAFRKTMNADIGLQNGGGLRNGIPAGIVNYGAVLNALPFDNYIIKLEATGAQLMAMLEKCTSFTPVEDGHFPQVSGLRMTVHTQSHRVTDVEVLDAATGRYLPLDMERKYTIATIDYSIKGGFYGMLNACKVVARTTTTYCDCVAEYLKAFGPGKVDAAYATSQGRIRLVED